jgi:hypothetical protein
MRDELFSLVSDNDLESPVNEPGYHQWMSTDSNPVLLVRLRDERASGCVENNARMINGSRSICNRLSSTLILVAVLKVWVKSAAKGPS